jgi:type II secretory pathway component PulF
MPVYAYTALSKEGRRTSGTLNADSRPAALATMSKQGLAPITINETKDMAAAKKVADAAQAAAAPGLGKGRISQKAIESFTRELANLLAGGVPLARSLSLLRREAPAGTAKELWGAVHDDVVGGTALADAMAKFPRTFTSVYVAMVRAGEAGGFLDVVLSQIAEFREREADLKGKVKAAMIYPCLLACLAVMVVFFLMYFFIPRFSLIFTQFGGNLPALTQAIILVSNTINSRYGLLVLGGIVAIVITFRRAMATQDGRRKVEEIMLAAPVLGTVLAHFALVRFARMLGTLVGAGVPLVAALRVAREALGNQTLQDTVASSIEQVQQGTALSKSLEGNVKLFPPSVVEMIAVAEETGRLDKELVRLATSYEGDLDRQLRMLVSILEPLMLFLMAAIIGTIVVGMLLPVFNLQELIHT